MFVRVIPYELVENLFGTWVADNFNKINIVLLVLGFFCWALFGKHTNQKKVTSKTLPPKNEEYIYCVDENGRLTPEEKELAKQIKIDRSQPSYEEWKAARERENNK